MQEYNHVDQQLHVLAQLIARTNRSFVPAKEDDSHTNIYFDTLSDRIIGRWIEKGDQKFLAVLDLSTWQYCWLDDKGQVLQSHSIQGKTTTTLLEEWSLGLDQLGLSPAGFDAPMHYDLPEYSIDQSPMDAPNSDSMDLWRRYRTLANQACEALLGQLNVGGETRIWPHHFDTGIYVNANARVGIGFGLAMEDAMAGAPYFYLAGYGLQGDLQLDVLSDLSYGRWEMSEHWKGAILPITLLEEGSDEPLFTFIKESLSSFLRA